MKHISFYYKLRRRNGGAEWKVTMYSMLIAFALSNLLYFALHVTSGGSFPKPLSPKEERECLEKIKEGDQEAKNKLIEHNLRLVAHIIKRYYSSIRDQEDLISIGTIGLIKAASTFDYDKGTRFATYASRCIENAMLFPFTQKPAFTGHREKIHILFVKRAFEENMHHLVAVRFTQDKNLFHYLLDKLHFPLIRKRVDKLRKRQDDLPCLFNVLSVIGLPVLFL